MVLAPHTDDGELGCGGTISKLIARGSEVFYVAFSIAEESVPPGFPSDVLDTEVRSATAVLGIPPENLTVLRYKVRRFPEFRQEILEDLVGFNKSINPDVVFLPSSFDVHQDHKTIFEEGRRAFKTKTLLGYEFMWNSYSFGATFFSVLQKRDIDAKISSLSEYRSQVKRLYTKDELVMGMANFRGLQVGQNFVEAFEVIRWIED